MFNNEKKLPIRINRKSGSDTISEGKGKRNGCKDAPVHDKTGLITVFERMLNIFITGGDVAWKREWC